MQVLYTIIYSLGFLLLSPAFLYKMWKRGKYRANFLQRFGRYAPELRARLAQKTGRRCWIQAVSVGEVNVALVFIRELQRQLPDCDIALSTTTSTGYALARERLPAEVALLYFPQDFPWCVRRAYDLVQPDFIVLMESELWPNFIWAGARRNVPIFMVNARMSPRSARRFRRIRWLFSSVARHLTLVCAQSADNAAAYRGLGVAAERVVVTGNVKYDMALPKAGERKFDPAAVLATAGVKPGQPVLVAGSTHPGEEEILFDLVAGLRKKFSELFLVLVPRHVERTPEIVEFAMRKGMAMALRSDFGRAQPPAGPQPANNGRAGGSSLPQCLLVNTTGELRWFYETATVIFVGKSLVGQGGQNIVEAAASGHPVVFGPHMQNFKAIAAEFVAAGAGVQVRDAAELAIALTELLASPDRRRHVADAARQVIQANLGATVRTVELIRNELPVPSS
jgi:3-deoxy-D-manno-octulosonic-acid transferase